MQRSWWNARGQCNKSEIPNVNRIASSQGLEQPTFLEVHKRVVDKNKWILQFTSKVTQLLQLCSMEVEAIKQQLQKAWKDREEFRSRVSGYKFLLETVQTSLSEEVRKTQALEKCAASQYHLARLLANHYLVMCLKLGLKFSTWRT